VLAKRRIDAIDSIQLKIGARERSHSFWYRTASQPSWTALAEDQDGSLLSTEIAGGFVGTVMGPYVRND
jgi:alpha-N-arabinofuranosidase